MGYAELQRVASNTVGAKASTALSELLTLGYELEALSTTGEKCWSAERDPRIRTGLADTVNALQSLAVQCWSAVFELRGLVEDLAALDRSNWKMRPSAA